MTDRPSVADVSRLFLEVLGPARPTALAAAAAAPDPGRAVELAGTARADGPLLTAPLSGRPCVWFRAVTSPFREPLGSLAGGPLQRIAPPPVVPSSAFPPARASVHRDEPQQEERSSAPFLLADGGAAIAVDPAHVLIDSADVSVNDYRRDDRGLATALCQEWIVAPDARLHAFGAVERGPSGARLVPGPGPAAVVSSSDRATLTARSGYGAGTASPRRVAALILVPVAVALVVIVLLIVGVL